MPRIDIRINKPEMQITYADIKPGHVFWCTDGFLNLKSKDGKRAIVLDDGQIWEPANSERVRPASVAMIEV